MNLLNNAIFKIPTPVNEPVFDYAPGSMERTKLKAALDDIAGKKMGVKTVQGSELMVDAMDGVKVDAASVVTADIETSNGVIPFEDSHLVSRAIQLLGSG